MIILPEHRIIQPSHISPVHVGNLGIKTRYMFISVCPKTGHETPLTGWSNNILLTSGRNVLSTQSGWFNNIQVGTDSTAPTTGDTQLGGYVAGTANIESTDTGNASVYPWFGWKRKRFRYLPGEVSGILAEVALAWGTTDTGNCAFRALIVDINGDQTTVTPLINEYLDIIAEVRLYPPLVDVTGTMVFDSVTYDYIVRAALVTGSYWSGQIGSVIGEYTPFSNTWYATDGDIGATLDLGPSGVVYSSNQSSGYNSAYSSNSYQQAFGMHIGPTGCNATTGSLLRSFLAVSTAGAFQIQFDSQASPGDGIPKTDSSNMGIQMMIGWGDAGPVFSGTIGTQAWTDGVAITPVDVSTYINAESADDKEYTLLSGSLPSGVTLSSTTGIISGTPSGVDSGTAAVHITNEVGQDDSNVFSWSVT